MALTPDTLGGNTCTTFMHEGGLSWGWTSFFFEVYGAKARCCSRCDTRCVPGAFVAGVQDKTLGAFLPRVSPFVAKAETHQRHHCCMQ